MQIDHEFTIELHQSRHLNNAKKFILNPVVTSSKCTEQAKHIIFVLDRSGSMYGDKLQVLKTSLKNILKKLSVNDFFSIIVFNKESKVLVKHRKISDNSQQIFAMVDQIRAEGGTSIFNGIKQVTTELIDNNPEHTSILLFTDGVDDEYIDGKKYTNWLRDSFRNSHSAKFSKSDCSLPIIPVGIGVGYNQKFFAELAAAANLPANIHIESEKDFIETFNEINSLFAQKTSPVTLSLTLNGKEHKLELGEMYFGVSTSKVLVLDLPEKMSEEEKINIQLIYNDNIQNRSISLNRNEIDYTALANFIFFKIAEYTKSTKSVATKIHKLTDLFNQFNLPLLPDILDSAKNQLKAVIDAYAASDENKLRKYSYAASYALLFSSSCVKSMDNTDYAQNRQSRLSLTSTMGDDDKPEKLQAKQALEHIPDIDKDFKRFQELLEHARSGVQIPFTLKKNECTAPQFIIEIDDKQIKALEKCIEILQELSQLPLLFNSQQRTPGQLIISWTDKFSNLLNDYYQFFFLKEKLDFRMF